MKFCNYDIRDNEGSHNPFGTQAAQNWKAKQEHNAKCFKALKKTMKKNKKKGIVTPQSEW